MERVVRKKETRQAYSFWIKPDVRQKVADYCEEHGLLTGVFLERIINEKLGTRND